MHSIKMLKSGYRSQLSLGELMTMAIECLIAGQDHPGPDATSTWRVACGDLALRALRYLSGIGYPAPQMLFQEALPEVMAVVNAKAALDARLNAILRSRLEPSWPPQMSEDA